MIRFEVGELQVSLFSAGQVLLDGGGMFGVVPKPLWERQRCPDERNRIPLALNLLVIDDGRRKILVDAGVGSKMTEKAADIFGVKPLTAEELLAPLDLRPEDIDLVVNTHLHFDHAGGNTYRDAEGGLRVAFPNARYVVQQAELDVVDKKNPRIVNSFIRDDFQPLLDEPDRLQPVDGPHDLGHGIHLIPAPGHTPGMQRVDLCAGDERWTFVADLFPTTSHLRPEYGMAFDLEPLVATETKVAFLAEAIPQKWRVIFEHDTEVTFAVFEESAGRVQARPLTVEA